MNIINHIVEKKKNIEDFYIDFYSCVHLGAKTCDEKLLKKHIRETETTKNCSWVDLGDKCDLIVRHDRKRFNPANVRRGFKIKDLDTITKVQSDLYTKFFSPIKSQCIGIGEGNHEASILQNYGQDIHKDICDDLGVKDLGFASFIRFIMREKNRSFSFLLFVTHGSGSAKDESVALRQVMSLEEKFEADVYVCGHYHKRVFNVCPKETIGRIGNMIFKKDKAYGVAGTYYDSYKLNMSNYAEKKLYKPSKLGKIRLKITAGKCINEYGYRLPPIFSFV